MTASMLLQSVVIGASSTLCLLVFVLSVNVIVGKLRQYPVTEYDRAVLKLTAVFVVVALVLHELAEIL